MLGLGLINKPKIDAGNILRPVKDGLKLWMPYKKKGGEVQFVGTGSTSFDGSDDYVDITGVISSLSSAITGTIMAWVKPVSGTTEEYILNFGDANANELIGFKLMGDGDLLVQENIGGTGQWQVRTDSAAFSSGVWTHIALTQDGIEPVIYIDGVAVAQTVTPTTDKTVWFDDTSGLDDGRIGAKLSNSGYDWFTGSIKNVAIWNRALTATEVQNVMYKTYAEVYGRLADNLVSWWALDATNLGSELITNGDFRDDLTNWKATPIEYTVSVTEDYYPIGSSKVKVSRLAVGGDDGYFGARPSGFSLVAGKSYQLSFDFVPIFGVPPKVTINATSFSGTVRVTLHAENSLTKGNTSSTFTATHTETSFLSFFNTSTNATTYTLDNITLKEVQMEDLEGSNEGSIYGATIDTDVYGGDTPVKPRAIDNAPTVQADAIGSGSALFDGTDDYISVADNSDIQIDGDMSIAFWMKRVDTAGVADGLVVKRDGGGTNYQLDVNNSDGVRIFDGAREATSTSTIPVNTWTHVAWTIDSGQAGGTNLYINGVNDTLTFDSGTTITITANDAPLLFGHNEQDASYWYKGYLCQVGIWEAVLTQAQIQSIMEKTYEELTASEKEDLVSYWALDETIESSGSGASVVYDKVDTTLGSDVITNGSMELDSDWISVGSVTTNEQSKTQKYSGSYSRRMVTADSGWTGIKATGISVTQGAVYKLTYYIYGVSGSSVRVGFYSTGGWATKADGSAFENSSEGYTNGSWTEKIIYIKTTGTGDVTGGSLQFRSYASVLEVYIDNVSLEKIGGNHGVLV